MARDDADKMQSMLEGTMRSEGVDPECRTVTTYDIAVVSGL